MIRFVGTNGNDAWIDPDRVTHVTSEGVDSRGYYTIIHLDSGASVSVYENPESAVRKITEAKAK